MSEEVALCVVVGEPLAVGVQPALGLTQADSLREAVAVDDVGIGQLAHCLLVLTVVEKITRKTLYSKME